MESRHPKSDEDGLQGYNSGQDENRETQCDFLNMGFIPKQ
jgi:hypothetical protein